MKLGRNKEDEGIYRLYYGEKFCFLVLYKNVILNLNILKYLRKFKFIIVFLLRFV